ISVTGSGFNTGDAGTCTFGQAPASPLIVNAATCTINSNGQVTGGFIVNTGATPGTYTLTVTGTTGDSASASFTVTVNTPFIVLTPSIGSIGTIVAVTGSGFNTGDAGTCTFGQAPASPLIVNAATCTINSAGQLTGSGFSVNSGSTPGVYTLTVTGVTLDSASASFTVRGPQVVLSPSSGPIGTHVTVTGSGFDTADVGTCIFQQSPATPFIVNAASCTINSSGQMTGGFIVNTGATPGTYLIQVKGSSGDISDPPFMVTSNAPTITINPNAAPIGTKISVTGSGFNTGDAGTCTFGQAPASPLIVNAATCTINSAGQLTGSGFSVNSGSTPGVYTLTVTGVTLDSASASFTVRGPQVVLSPSSGPIGTHVTVTGSGFDTADVGTCIFQQSPATPFIVNAASCTINSSGQMTGGFIVNTGATPGTYLIQVKGSSGDISDPP